MDFIVITDREYEERIKTARNVIFLFHSNWDDWYRYETIFHVVYVDSIGVEFIIGNTKIGKVGMEGAHFDEPDKNSHRITQIPKESRGLSQEFFSLGQDVNYYEKLIGFGNDVRIAILKGLRDIAFDEASFTIALKEDVTRMSLLREVSLLSVTGQLRRLSRGDAKLSRYSFKYESPKNSAGETLELTFKVVPDSHPSTNIHVIIGRNGVGKTYLMTNMINCLIHPDGFESGRFTTTDTESPMSSNFFANLIFVSFSAFDENTPILTAEGDIDSIKYSYVGLKGISKKGNVISKSSESLKKDFSTSLANCKKLGKMELWMRIVDILNSDPIFSDNDAVSFGYFNPKDSNYHKDVQALFNKYSSGHRIVLLTITKIIESIEEKSLIILDEPESHLHPPLLASFTRALSKLLIARNGVGIVATHSPVIVQEVPKDCIWILNRQGMNSQVERFPEETFGENVGSLTKELFGLEVQKSGFYQLIEDAVSHSWTYEEVLNNFNCDLGKEAQAIARTLLYQKTGVA
jgi:ABC-type multidrug transport system ATPase subunit